ncbi:MAG: response regulator [Bradymonadia bacterium]
MINSNETKVLIIEDDPHVRAILGEVLERAGFETHEAVDGQEGYERARRINPHLILCDIDMSGLDGHSVLRIIREDPQLSHIPFIFLTGSDCEETRKEGFSLGADDYLTKPFSVETLLKIIETRLSRQRAMQAHYEQILQAFAGRFTEEIQKPLLEITGYSIELRHQWREMRPADIEMLLELIERQGHFIAALTQSEVQRHLTPVTERI